MRAFLFLATLAALLPASVSFADNPCADVTFSAWEFIEPQGAFGLATPKAIGGAPLQALNKAVADAWTVARRDGLAAGQANFELARFCEMAKRAYSFYAPGVKLHLMLACSADSESASGGGEYPGGPPAITGECALIVNGGGIPAKPDFLALKHYSFGYAFHRRLVTGGENRHDLLDDPKNRVALYAEALRNAINEKVETTERLGGLMDITRENQHHYDSWGHRLSLLEPGECGSEGAALALDGFDAARRWGHAFGGERRSSCSRSGLGPSVAPPRDAEI